jgi:hypothetical protein
MKEVRQPFTAFHKRWCTDCTKKISLSPFALYFREHPMTSVPNYDHYLSVVKNPIWLKEVMERLRFSCYNYVHEWVTDMQGVWENAILYNAPDTPGYDCALVLKRMFEKRCQPIPSCLEDINEIDRVRILRRIENLLTDPPEGVKSLSWSIPVLGDGDGGGLEEVKWDSCDRLEVAEDLKRCLKIVRED